MPSNGTRGKRFRCVMRVGADAAKTNKAQVGFRSTGDDEDSTDFVGCLVEPREHTTRGRKLARSIRDGFLKVHEACAGLEGRERLVHAVAAANQAINKRVLSGELGDRFENAVWINAVSITETGIDYIGIGPGLIAMVCEEQSHVLRTETTPEDIRLQPVLAGTAIRPGLLNVGRAMPTLRGQEIVVLGAACYNAVSTQEIHEASRWAGDTPRSGMQHLFDILGETVGGPRAAGTLVTIGYE